VVWGKTALIAQSVSKLGLRGKKKYQEEGSLLRSKKGQNQSDVGKKGTKERGRQNKEERRRSAKVQK